MIIYAKSTNTHNAAIGKLETPIKMLSMAPGGFLVFGCLIALVNKISKGRAIKKKEFNCSICPSAAFCRSACTEGCRKEGDAQ